MNTGQFITDIVVVTSKDKCPQGYTILATTVSGNDANLYEGSFLKGGGRYLCYAKVQNSPAIVTDLNIVKEKDSIPTGLTAVKTCANDASEKSFRKHVLCLKTTNIQAATSGVVNIVAIQQSKGEKCQGNFYTISTDVNGINICFQTMPNSIARQPPPYASSMMYRPPTVQPGYPGVSQPFPYPTAGHHMPVPASLQGTASPANNQPPSPSNKYTSAIQGVMFQFNPKFELLWNKPNFRRCRFSKLLRQCGDLTKTFLKPFKTLISDKITGNRDLTDIEKKYGYTFETEQNILSAR